MLAKIVFICTQKEAGGVQTRATQMQKSLDDDGIDTTVIFLYSKREPFPPNPKHITLHQGKPYGLFAYLLILYRLWRYLSREQPLTIVGFAHYASPIATMFGLACGVKRRVATQTNPPETMPTGARILDKICGYLGVYTHNICASKTVLDGFTNYPERYRKRLLLIYNGVQKRHSSLSKAEARNAFGLNPKGNLLIACGRLSPQKNHQFLLGIISEMKDVHLAILGDGELRADLVSEAERLRVGERVHFVGEHPANRVGDFLRAGDIFVFPSKFEAFGLALAEAMLEELPIITADFPAAKEVVADSGYRLPLNQDVWVSCIQQLLKDPTLRQRCGVEAREQARHFTYEAMLQSYRKVISPSREGCHLD